MKRSSPKSATGIASLIKLDDPVGKTLSAMQIDKGLELYKVSCPIRRYQG